MAKKPAERSKSKKIMSLLCNPNTPGRWFMLRLFLEGRLEDFMQMRRFLYKCQPEGKKHWGSTFWQTAKMYFDYGDVYQEQERVYALQAQLSAPLEYLNHKLEEHRKGREAMENKENKQDLTYQEEVRWAFQNWQRYLTRRVGTKNGGWHITDEARLAEEAPTLGAAGLIQYAADNMKDFQGLASRVLAKVADGTEDEKETHHSRKSIEELDALLENLG